MCREYSCDPVTLAKVPLETVLRHMTCMNAEAGFEERRRVVEQQMLNARRR
jgi:hypothetical protein